MARTDADRDLGDHGHDHGGACHGATTAPKSPPDAIRKGLTYLVRGLDCVEEVAILRREIGPLVGGEEHLAFNVLDGTMTVLGQAKTTTPASVVAAVGRTGMEAEVWRSGRDRPDGDQGHRRVQVWLTALSGLSVAVGFAIHVWLSGTFLNALDLLSAHAGQAVPLAEKGAYALAIALGARFVVVKALSAARRRRPDINLLMVIAVCGALGIGEWFEAATVTFLFSLSLALEGWSIGRARRAIAVLLDLAAADGSSETGRRRGTRRSRRRSAGGITLRRHAGRGRFPSTERSRPAPARSTRRRSPGKAFRSPSESVPRSSPEPSTAKASLRSRAPSPRTTRPWPTSFASSRRRTAAGRPPSNGWRSSPASTRPSSSSWRRRCS